MTKPDSITQELWDTLDEDEKRFMQLHEWLHQLFFATSKTGE